jgi:hypothetical protein
MHQRHQLEQLCRYITRPAIANERLSLNHAGDVVLQLKTPYQDGTTHIVMSPRGELKPKIQRIFAVQRTPRHGGRGWGRKRTTTLRQGGLRIRC